jgi:zinc D-Ala-D-Ala dipeptidase
MDAKRFPLDNFVDLAEVDPTIVASVRYATDENFVGCHINGYGQPRIWMTLAAAQALKKVQAEVRKDGYCLVVYDAYRPQRAVDHFLKWSHNPQDQKKKEWYYPRVNKEDSFDLGYIAKKSGHSRGSTVDLTLISLGKSVQPIQPQLRRMNDGTKLFFLDDGTVDMGSSFDLFDQVSRYESGLISPGHQENRRYLKQKMEEGGFKNYELEWWHFTLKNEPYPDTYFDFSI